MGRAVQRQVRQPSRSNEEAIKKQSRSNQEAIKKQLGGNQGDGQGGAAAGAPAIKKQVGVELPTWLSSADADSVSGPGRGEGWAQGW